MTYAMRQHKRVIGNACGVTGTAMRSVVGTHTGDIKRGWFINNTGQTKGGGVMI